MAKRLKRLERGKGLIYVEIDGKKRNVTLFLKDFLEKFDSRLFQLATEKKAINKRKENYAFFLLGANSTIFSLNNHFLIHTENEEKALELLNSYEITDEKEESRKIELPENSDRKFNLKRFKRGKGMIYIELKENEQGMNEFLARLLKEFDEELYELLKSSSDKVIFLSGQNNTIFNVDNHVLIYAKDEESCINLLQKIFEI